MPSTVTARAVITNQSKKKDGTYPIRIRITFKRKSRFISTNLVARPEQLTKELDIKDRTLRHKAMDLVAKVQEAASSLDTFVIDTMEVDDVVKGIESVMRSGEKPSFLLDFPEYGRKIADEKPKNSRTNYMCAIHAFCEYMGSDCFDISLVTSSVMRGFEAALRREHGTNARAVSLYTSAIAYIHKRAQLEYNNEELGEVNIKNPFAYYKCPRQKQAAHRNFDESLIKTMLRMRKSLEGRERLGVDVYLLSFALMGMNCPDLYSCRAPKNGLLVYERTKTRERREDNAEMRVKIEDCILPIYNIYKGTDGKHAFNFHERYSNYKNLGRAVNVGLSMFKGRIDYDRDIVLYSARHTWASVAYSLGIEKTAINDCLCHVDPGMRVTDVYVQKDWSVLWKANKKVLRRFKWD